MFWDDIRDIKDWMNRLTDRLMRIDHSIAYIVKKMDELEYSEHENIMNLLEKIEVLIEDANRKEAVYLAEATLDKFEEYMKNVDKLNSMINEFKGCVAMARASLTTGKLTEAKKKPRKR